MGVLMKELSFQEAGIELCVYGEYFRYSSGMNKQEAC